MSSSNYEIEGWDDISWSSGYLEPLLLYEPFLVSRVFTFEGVFKRRLFSKSGDFTNLEGEMRREYISECKVRNLMFGFWV